MVAAQTETFGAPAEEAMTSWAVDSSRTVTANPDWQTSLDVRSRPSLFFAMSRSKRRQRFFEKYLYPRS